MNKNTKHLVVEALGDLARGFKKLKFAVANWENIESVSSAISRVFEEELEKIPDEETKKISSRGVLMQKMYLGRENYGGCNLLCRRGNRTM